MSYISYRLATITASVIFILVILLLILWTGFFGNTTSIAGAFDKDQSAAPIVRQQSNNTDKRHEDERREPLVSDRSVAAPLESNTTDISNEGKSLFSTSSFIDIQSTNAKAEQKTSCHFEQKKK